MPMDNIPSNELEEKFSRLPPDVRRMLEDDDDTPSENTYSSVQNKPVGTAPVQTEKPKKKKKKIKTRKVIFRGFLCFITLIMVLTGGILGAVAVILKGPSVHARDLLISSFNGTSALKFVPKMFFSESELAEIDNNNSIISPDDITDVNLVKVNEKKSDPAFDKNKIEVVEVKGGTYKGLMMIINDPSRVYVGTSGEFGDGNKGCTVMEMIKRDGCIAGANGGGFEDSGGTGTGGIPIGVVISNGELKYSSPVVCDIMGIDKDNKLVVGKMTTQEAIDRNLRDAVSFGPLLIVNGTPAKVTGTAGGVNPRTAIGQRADGAILLLVIDGRQANSLGATYSDLIDVFLQFGAVNAGNLDGGSSSHLIYKGEIISTCSSLYGPRNIPTSILVKGE